MLKAILIGSFLFASGALPALANTGTILVFPFENQSADRKVDWIGEGIAELILERLQAEPNLYVFQRDERLAGFEKLGIPETAVISRATAMKIGWDSGADYVISGRFTSTVGDFSIYARLVNLAASGASQEIKVSGRLEDFIPLTNTLSWQLLKIMVPETRSPESDYRSRPPVPRSAFENFMRGILSPDPQRRSAFFDTAIRLRPQYAEAIFELGRLRYFEGDFKASSLQLEKIQAGDANYAMAHFVVALNHYQLGDYARAAGEFASLPQTYDVLVNLGAAHSARGETAAALATWRQAVERDPYAVEAIFNIGYASFLRGDNDAALKALEQTLRLQGRDAEAMFLLGRTYERLGRAEESQKTIAQAVRISSRVERWSTQLPPKLERLRPAPVAGSLRASQAERLMTPERLLRRAKGQDLASWLEFIQSQVDSQLYGDAARELQQALQVYPQSSDVHILRGDIWERQKNYDQALNEYELAIAARPSAESYVMVARIHRLMNHNALALVAIDQALRLEPDHAAARAMRADLQKAPPGKQDLR